MLPDKYLPASILAETVAQLRRAGRTIVFTNGCFDILHPGHIYTLTQAKALGEVLIVGLNSDASVKRLKGERRPILSQDERAVMLAALEAVDYVTTFEEATPYTLIQQLQPDVLVKGGDWESQTVVGQDVVEAKGGKVVLISYQEGVSTTGIIERVLVAYGLSTATT